MTEHSPGTWEHLNGDLIGTTVRERTAIVADCCAYSGPNGSQIGPDQRKANARLIAAAPEMLAALEPFAALEFPPNEPLSEGLVNLIARGKLSFEDFRRAAAAVAKARGE